MRKNRASGTVFLFLAIAMGYNLMAQAFQTNIRTFSTEDGLSHPTVLSILQDKEGFLWLGTRYGLNRFDGHDFVWFTKQNHGLQSNHISFLFQATGKRLWLADRQDNLYDTLFSSLELFDPHLGQSQPLGELLPEPLPFSLEAIRWMDGLPDGSLLLSTLKGLYLLHDQKGVVKLNLPEKFRLIKAWSSQDIWGMLGGELIQVDTGGTISQRFRLLAQQQAFQVEKDARGRYWVAISMGEFGKASFGQGMIWLIEHGEKRNAPFDFSFLSPYELHLQADPRRNEVLLFYDTDLLIWNDSLQQVTRKTFFGGTLGKKKYDAFYRDNRGILWYGHREGLLAIQRTQSPFQQLLKGEGTNSFPTRGIGQLGNRLFVNSSRDCISFDLEEQQPGSFVAPYPQFKYFKPFAMYTNFSGELWTANDRLYRLDSRGDIVQEIGPKEGLGGRIWSFFQSADSTWWISAGEDHIYQFNPAVHEEPVLFNQYNGFRQLFNTRKWHICEGTHGIWIASENGLYLMDKEKGIVARYAEDEPGRYFLPAKIFHHIYQDRAGIMWLATGDAGLVRVPTDSLLWSDSTAPYQQLNRSQGMPSNELYASLEDHANHLWISTANGLVQLNKKTLQINTYFEEQGITHNEFNRLSWFKAPSGRMYFGGLNGVTSLDPGDFYHVKPFDPPLVIAQVSLFSGEENRLIDLGYASSAPGKLDYYPDDKYLKLRFSLQDYFYSDRVSYFYIIEGWQDDWIKLNDNELQLSGLPYGQHQLRVRAQGVDKRFSEKEVLLTIQVHRPFYLQSWFLILSALAIALSLWQVFYWRVTTLQRRQQLLEQMVQRRTQTIMQDKQTIEQQAAELRELDEVKSRFFANISHELRTPLTLILGPLARVLKRKRLDAEDENSLQMMQKHGEQLLYRINELLDLSRLEAQKLELNKDRLELQPFLKTLLENVQPAADLKGLKLVLHAESGTDISILSDREKLEKILSNFLSNALKFTPEGGDIRMHVFSSPEGVEQVTQTHALTIAVSDSGPGIHPAELERVFDRFYQSPQTDHAGGTGIGLSLAKELAELLGGKVWAENNPGQGATFFLQIPLAEEEAEQLSEKALEVTLARAVPEPLLSPAPKDPAATILLVEDNPDLQRYLGELLSAYQVIPATNGAEALDILQGQKGPGIQLIISDIMMPVMDGLELLSNLKSDKAFGHIPVIMLTARTGLESKLQALRIGIDDYLTKPFHEEELLASMANLLRNYSNRLNAAGSSDAEADGMEEAAVHSASDLRWLEEVEQRILEGIGDSRFNLSELADQLSLSPRRIQQKIKALTGLTPKQYQREIQLEYARRLLESGEYATVAEVSYRVGFESQQYFSTLFEKRYGKKPSSY